MTDVKYVRDVKRLLEPIFESLLSAAELESSTFRLERVTDGGNGGELPGDTIITTNDTWVRWQVLGEEGGSGSLRPDDGEDALIRFVQSELQDFIAESRFGWGQLRVPRDLPWPATS
ncbi:hypothetical protein CVO76_03015 [Arthrobacter agilis]|uniref:Uncharacterized protein n=1 Tax=Arthrobacter agilis TaxID=37921 RepID=A0A2L0UBV0_9MICC|nr:hypothetical protein [Arthrobacter agilis]AUZ86724.1 hypothetical protein CVO76_03015 [Arthrobacter agilis]